MKDMRQLELFESAKPKTPVNVASVPMRSPFRYPGGKTWFVPYARRWLHSFNGQIDLIEPFAGGGIISLTAAFEQLAQKVIMVERDENIAAVWRTIMGPEARWLVDKILNLKVTASVVNEIFETPPRSLREKAFLTLLRNRLSRGGILAHGAGLIKNGENGKGLTSRWYPDTLQKRILDIQKVKHRIHFIQGDGIEIVEQNLQKKNAVFFIDPPYTVAGRRLYKYHEIDHRKLFALANDICGDFVMTYDEASEIKVMALQYGFEVERVLMKTTHHTEKYELVISKKLDWLKKWL